MASSSGVPAIWWCGNSHVTHTRRAACRDSFGGTLTTSQSSTMLITARLYHAREGSKMAKLVFGMNQSLDGYIDHMAFGPSPTLFRHFIEEAQGQAGSVYGRQMYEIMRYWDDDHPEWGA